MLMLSSGHRTLYDWNAFSTSLDGLFSNLVPGGLGDAIARSLLATNEERMLARVNVDNIAHESLRRSAF